MPAAKSKSALSQMLQPLSEDELEQTAFDQTMDSENLDPIPRSRAAKSATTRARGPPATKAAASKVSKPRPASRRVSGPTAGTARGKTSSRRQALEERNAPNGSDTEEVEDFDEEQEEAHEKPYSRRAEPTYRQSAARQFKAAEKLTTQRGKPSSRGVPTQRSARYVPDTQSDSMDIEQSIEEVTERPVQPPPRAAHRPQSQIRHGSKPRQASVPRSRAGSMSDPERRTHDPALRRKLGEMTKKFESLDIKYRQLKEIGMRDAESNFDRLRKSTEQRASDQDALVTSLKKELAAVRASQSDSRALKSEVADLKAEIQRLTTETTRLSGEAKTASSSLADAQNEGKALTAKLAAARDAQKAAETALASAKVPGNQRNNANGATVAAFGTDMATLKLKEELYSDLTGLMLLGVKNISGNDVFDCIQTGRNGTLHFHLNVPTATPSDDDIEWEYTPLLDAKNDGELLDVLPDYLTEEICFPRSSAAKFYIKVLDSMAKKVLVEE